MKRYHLSMWKSETGVSANRLLTSPAFVASLSPSESDPWSPLLNPRSWELLVCSQRTKYSSLLVETVLRCAGEYGDAMDL